MRAWKVVRFEVAGRNVEVGRLLQDFRLMVNKAVRFGLLNRCSSLGAISRGVYRGLRAEHQVYSQHVSQACAVAASILRNYRKRLRRGLRSNPPFVKRLFARIENQAYTLDRTRGVLRFPIRAGTQITIQLPLSEYHRSILSDPAIKLGSLTLTESIVALAVSRDSPRELVPTSIVAFDTNESSMDGVLATRFGLTAVKVPFPEVRQIQATHFRRRRRLGSKKAHDRRTQAALLSKEGRRERRRINYRIHEVTNAIIGTAMATRSAIAIEDLRGLRPQSWSRQLNRRLAQWPRRRIHSLLEHKARWRGIPLIKVNPKNTSRTCPACGFLANSRKGAMSAEMKFRCRCGWSADRQTNAALNILKTAIARDTALARAVRFQPGAMRHDVVILQPVTRRLEMSRTL